MYDALHYSLSLISLVRTVFHLGKKERRRVVKKLSLVSLNLGLFPFPDFGPVVDFVEYYPVWIYPQGLDEDLCMMYVNTDGCLPCMVRVPAAFFENVGGRVG